MIPQRVFKRLILEKGYTPIIKSHNIKWHDFGQRASYQVVVGFKESSFGCVCSHQNAKNLLT